MGTLDRLKQFASFGSVEPGAYVCRGCDGSFDVQYHVCPVCGGYSVDLQRDDGS